MPELPEMQALSERLGAVASGSILSRIDSLQFSALKTVEPPPDSLVGRELTAVGRRGKYVILELGGRRILFHLSQGGRVDVERPAKRTRPKGAVVRFAFDNGLGVLVKEFGTERKTAWWVLDDSGEGPLAGLGPEPGSEEFERFVTESDDARRVHTILRDQRTVAGVGRGYSDDILHHAMLSPYASLRSLDSTSRAALIEGVKKVLEAGLVAERRRTGGLPTKIGDHFTVHGKYGTPCPRCSEDLRRVSYESHEVTYCPACQTGGKILADRRMSRIVR